jgi:hypothetical protein
MSNPTVESSPLAVQYRFYDPEHADNYAAQMVVMPVYAGVVAIKGLISRTSEAYSTFVHFFPGILREFQAHTALVEATPPHIRRFRMVFRGVATVTQIAPPAGPHNLAVASIQLIGPQ